MLNGLLTSVFAAQVMKRLATDLAYQLRQSSVPPLEFAETIINIAAATKQQPTTAYRTFMTALQLSRTSYQKTDAQAC